MSDERRPADPRRLLEEAGRWAKKSWGQNFLVDQNILELIAAEAAAGRPAFLIELGAGLGALTYHLVRLAEHVVAVERDRDLVPMLRRTLGWAENLEIMEANALTLDYAALAARSGGPVHVVGNLPYQLASRIMVGLTSKTAIIARAVFLVQREVAERICAPAGDSEYSLLSVLIQRAFSPSIARRVPAAAFFPRPRIESALLTLSRGPDVLGEADDNALVATARAAFSARRKTLRNSLSAGLKIAPAAAEKALHDAGISPSARAEVLAVADFLRLGRALSLSGLLPSSDGADHEG